MTERYEIADYLTVEQRQAAIDVDYPVHNGVGLCPRALGGGCPMTFAIGGHNHPPTSGEIAEKIVGPRSPESTTKEKVKWWTVQDVAYRFIMDWDAGRIPSSDLPIALGLESICKEVVDVRQS